MSINNELGKFGQLVSANLSSNVVALTTSVTVSGQITSNTISTNSITTNTVSTNSVTTNTVSTNSVTTNTITTNSNTSTFGTAAYIVSNGNIGVSNSSPASKLTVAGTIESTTGGVKFPDGSTQSSAGASTGKAIAMAIVFG